MLLYILLALVIVLLICVIYWFWFCDHDTPKRIKARELINKSAGVFDVGARAALQTFADIENPTPQDRIRRANILRYNMLEGNLRADGNATRQIINDYHAALDGMTINNTRPGVYRLNAAPILADIMIRQITGLDADLRTQFTADDFMTDEELAGLIAALGGAVYTQAPQVQENIIRQRKAEATAQAHDAHEAVGNYFASATTWRDDRQNVHDSQVTGDLKGVLGRLKASARDIPSPDTAFSEAREYIRTHYQHEASQDKVTNALRGLDRLQQHEYITTYGEHEDMIFAYIWDRCNHPNNHESRDLMRSAVITSLADGVENGTQVCINGRCARMLGSLTTLDFDPIIANGAMTFEAYRNQIFQETNALFDQEYELAKSAGDPAAAYIDNPTIDAPMQTRQCVDKFVTRVKALIDNNMEQYRKKFNPNEYENIRLECYAAVEI